MMEVTRPSLDDEELAERLEQALRELPHRSPAVAWMEDLHHTDEVVDPETLSWARDVGGAAWNYLTAIEDGAVNLRHARLILDAAISLEATRRSDEWADTYRRVVDAVADELLELGERRRGLIRELLTRL